MRDAISVQNVGKQFRRYHPDRPTTLQEAIVRGLRRLGPEERFWALREVSFNVAPGRMLGIIGANGAGKSTLLRLIGGCGRPDEGRIEVHGRIGALLDVSAGFHPDLTGRENIFVAGVIGGLTRSQVARRFDSIVAFSELEEFIDNPLRTYSSGMQMRLGFSVAAHIEPDILLIDEVLAVGDLAFQNKCLERISRFRANGGTILLVSHEVELIEELCDEVVWLRSGRIAEAGSPGQVVEQYVAEMLPPPAETARVETQNEERLEVGERRMNKTRFGSLQVEITEVRRVDAHGHATTEMTGGGELRVEMDYAAARPVRSAIFYIRLCRPDGLCAFESSSKLPAPVNGVFHASGTVACAIDHLNVEPGRYNVDVGVYKENWEYAYDYQFDIYPLRVTAPAAPLSDTRPNARWEFGPASAAQPRLTVPSLLS